MAGLVVRGRLYMYSNKKYDMYKADELDMWILKLSIRTFSNLTENSNE